MQNAAFRTTTGCTQDTNIQYTHDESPHFPYTSTYSSTPHNTNRKHNIHHIRYTNTQHTSTLQGYLKNTIFNNGRYITNIPTDPHAVTDNKTNMPHIHTSIVSRHLSQEAMTKYCAHLHHTLAAPKRYFPASLVAPLPNSKNK